jgi:hypothetical protein
MAGNREGGGNSRQWPGAAEAGTGGAAVAGGARTGEVGR